MFHSLKRLWYINTIFLWCIFDYLKRVYRSRQGRQGEGGVEKGAHIGATMRLACEKLGPTAIKFGQVLSTRNDILPIGLVHELAHLQEGVTPMPVEDAIAIVEAEYQRPLAERFSWFSATPLGAASLSQVHEARLVETGELVVIKIQRPGVKAMVDADIDIIRRFVPLLERYIVEFRHIRLGSVVEEFYKTIRMEMDFKREMYNIIKFQQIFEKEKTVKVPGVYRKFCTDKLLVLEKIEGVRIDKIDELRGAGHDLNLLAKRLVSVLARQVFTAGVFNSDVHSGNIRVLPGSVIGLLDFGMVRSIDPETQKLMADIFLALVTKDARRMSHIMVNYTEPGHQLDVPRLTRDIHELITFYYDLPEEDISVENLLDEAMSLLSVHHLILPQQLIMLGRTAVMSEGILRLLAPTTFFVPVFAPFIKEAIKSRLTFENVGGELGKLVTDSSRAIRALPAALVRFLADMSDGVVRIETRSADLERLSQQQQRVSERMVRSLVVSIFCGVLLIVSLGTLCFVPQPTATTVLLGRGGLIGAVVLGVVLLYTLKRD